MPRLIVLRGVDEGKQFDVTGPTEIEHLAQQVSLMRDRILAELAEVDRAREELADRANELARSNADLEQFAYVASHDLQEPLRKVASFCQLLEQRYGDQLDERAQSYIAFAVDGAKRMQRLIDDLLAFSRVGTRGQQFQPVDCGQVLQDVLHGLRLAIEEAGAAITYENLPTVLGDRGQLYQLLQNLIANALKFRGKASPRIHVSATWHAGGNSAGGPSAEENPTWVFAITDNGIGIDPQYADRIFVIFQRLHSRAQYSGTGIGLAICKKIVERHGGRIWVESMVGYGATFYFRLPDRLGTGPQLRGSGVA